METFDFLAGLAKELDDFRVFADSSETRMARKGRRGDIGDWMLEVEGWK
jgi:hypothetical protein